PKGRISEIAHIVAGTIGAAVATLFALGGIALVRSDRQAGDVLARLIPTPIADLAFPIGFTPIAVRLVRRASPALQGRAVAALGIAAGVLINQYRGLLENQSLTPWLLILLVAGVVGAPIFALLGGIALFASLTRGNPPVVLPMM